MVGATADQVIMELARRLDAYERAIEKKGVKYGRRR
jgi:hypothetical protein